MAKKKSVQEELSILFPSAWSWYVTECGDEANAIEPPLKYQVDEMIAFLIRNVDHWESE
jgi:hypothetical protein